MKKRISVVSMCVVWGLCAACSQSVTPDEQPVLGIRLDMEAEADVSKDASKTPDMSTPEPDVAPDTTPDAAPDMATVEDMAPEDMMPDAGPVEPTAMLDAPASSEQITHPFSIDIQGNGSGVVGEVNVTRNLVSVVIDGESFEGVVQERQAWADFSLVLYQSLLVSEDDVRVVWFYCKQERLTWIYHEGSRSPMRDEWMNGSCNATDTETTTTVDLPAVSMTPPAPLQGYRVDGGDAIQIYGNVFQGQSFGVFGGERYRLYPFEEVDCSEECGSPGWYEIHTLVERERDDALGFIIIYLRSPGQIEAHYSIVWPGFEVITPIRMPATWSAP